MYRVVYILLIINKAGGLIFTREFHTGLAQLSSNDLLILAGTFHGVHAITRSLIPPPIAQANNLTHTNPTSASSFFNKQATSNSNRNSSSGGGGGDASNNATIASNGGTSTATMFPVKPSGLEVLETTLFRMTCFPTVTGTKFLLLTEPGQANVDVVMRRCYELYADYVMKNPFYTVDMPIRCAKFESALDSFIRARP